MDKNTLEIDEDLRRFADVYAKYIDSLYDLDNRKFDQSDIEYLVNNLKEWKSDFDNFIENSGWGSPIHYLPFGVLNDWDNLPYETRVIAWYMAKKCYASYLF